MKARSIDKVPSGVPGFDEITDGGFIRNSIVSLAGHVGSGKTIFGMQFLYMGATQFNENGMYIGFEEPKKMMYRNMLKFGWNLKGLEDTQKLTYLQYPAHEVDLFFEQEDTLINLVDKFAVARVVVDTVTVLGTHFPDVRTRREGMLKFMDKLRRWGCTTILIGELGDTTDVSRDIDSLSDAVIHLTNTLSKGVRKRGIEVVEMRGSKHSNRVHPLHITSKGIEVDPESTLEV